MEIALTGLLGAMFGSFLNVVAYRMPRRESIVWGASHCTSCGHPVKPYDNVPVLSWLLLRGRCRNCRAAISSRYPAVELMSAVLCVAVTLKSSSAGDIALGIALVLILLPVALIDLEHRIIPNRITGPGAVLLLVLGGVLDPSGEPARLIACAGAAGFLLVAALAYPGGMGMGDVKLAGVIGLALGVAVIPAILIALVSGVIAGAVVIARRGVAAGRKTAVPFGPFLAFGAVVGLFAGSPLIHWYSTTFIH